MTKTRDVLGLGISAVDDLLYVPTYPPANVKIPITRSARHAGGLACTAMAAIGQLGGSASYLARLGTDDLSTFIKSALASKNVDTTHVLPDPTAQPFHAIIIIDDSAARTVFYDCSKFHPLTPTDLPENLITSSKLILLDYLIDPPAIDIAKKIRALNVPILADIEGRSDNCRPLLPLIDYLIVSEEFAHWFADTSDTQSACHILAQSPRPATLVTAGPNGCYLSTSPSTAPVHIPAFPITPTDTNGCGDTFHGAFALAIARHFSVNDATTFATAAAALKATGKGGWSSLPTAPEVLTFLQQRLGKSPANNSLLQNVLDLSRATKT